MNKNKRIELLNCIKEKKATLVIKNAKVIDVFTEQIIEGDIAIYKDTILGIGNFSCENEIDAKGKYVAPGFIDSHIHIESSMTTPRNYASIVIPHGTTSIIADPHEIANVLGNTGIEFLLDQSDDVFLHIYMMLPSCVPCTNFEHNGCTLLAEDMKKLINHERVIGLGEVMDYVSLTNGEENMMDKIDLFKDMIIDGHAPSLFGETLDAYAIGGPVTDHECSTYEEVTDRLSRGLKVLIRMGSAANAVQEIFEDIAKNNLPTENICVCTDDKHLEDLKNEGHIDYILKTAVKCGIPAIKAIKMATLNSALTYNLKDTGAVAPGYIADLVLLDSLEDFNVSDVIINGKVMDKNLHLPKVEFKQNVTSAVNIAPLKEDCFKIKVEDKMPVIGVIDGQIITKLTYENVPTENGEFKPSDGYLKISVIERHHALGNIGLGIVKGFGLKSGALATTVAHDSHNLMVIGSNDEDMKIAVKELEKCGGGYVLVNNKEVLGILPLPIAGLMSDDSIENIIKTQKDILDKAYSLGVSKAIDPFITLSFLGLPVIPEIRITDMGLFDVNSFAFL